MTDLSRTIAEHVARTRFVDLPGDVVAITKKFILDTLGAGLAGSGAPGCAAIAGLFAGEGGRPDSSVLVFGGKLPAANAALVNSMILHAVEFDDTHDETTVHANASVLPAALAVAEQRGGVGGRALIEAVAVGVDVTCRLGFGPTTVTPWTPSTVFGYFGATVAVAKLLGFAADAIEDAIGIAYSQCAGNRQCNVDRALVKRMQIGFAARAGVQSCQFAAAGITGAKNVFNGSVGMAHTYFNGGFDSARVVEGLGRRFIGAELSIKPYPTARPTHGCIDAALALAAAHDLRPDDVAEIVVHVSFLVMRSGGAPFNRERMAQVEAQFSIAYAVALAIAHRQVVLADFMEQNIGAEPEVVALAGRIRVVQDQEPVGPGLTPIVLDLTTRDGRRLSHRIDVIKGNPRNPLDIDWVERKFRDCAAFSARAIPPDRLDRAAAMVRGLEAVEDVGEIVQVLS